MITNGNHYARYPDRIRTNGPHPGRMTPDPALQSPAKEAMAVFWGNAQGLKKTNYKPYKKLLVAVKALQLTEQDIFG